MWKYDDFYTPPTQAELRRRAEKGKKRSASSGKVMDPVIITGQQVADSWWGRAWCANLEKYADYQNRVGRGKSYVRAGAVIDLKLDGGIINARVQGSRKIPYKVEVKIDPLPEVRYQAVLKGLSNRIENLEAFLNGDFPIDMKSLITDPQIGLFPNPREIHFSCSCPDWASMCKHVAAVLYGIGSRLDRDCHLFFAMRGIEISDFIQRSVEEKLGIMLKNADVKSSRIIEDQSLKDLFGVLE